MRLSLPRPSSVHALFKTESRIQIVGFFFLLGLSALIGRLWWVQVIRSDFYRQKIRGSGQVTVRIPSVRGEIRDKNGIALVRNRPSFSVDFLLDDMVKGYGQAFGRANVPKLRHVYTVRASTRRPTSPTWPASSARPSCLASSSLA